MAGGAACKSKNCNTEHSGRNQVGQTENFLLLVTALPVSVAVVSVRLICPVNPLRNDSAPPPNPGAFPLSQLFFPQHGDPDILRDGCSPLLALAFPEIELPALAPSICSASANMSPCPSTLLSPCGRRPWEKGMLGRACRPPLRSSDAQQCPPVTASGNLAAENRGRPRPRSV